jgi:hypothetical protein
LESNWRYQRELWGVGGLVLGAGFSDGTVRYAFELISPIPDPYLGFPTHVLIVDSAVGEIWVYGHLLMGYFTFSAQGPPLPGPKLWNRWPVYPD